MMGTLGVVVVWQVYTTHMSCSHRRNIAPNSIGLTRRTDGRTLGLVASAYSSRRIKKSIISKSCRRTALRTIWGLLMTSTKLWTASYPPLATKQRTRRAPQLGICAVPLPTTPRSKFSCIAASFTVCRSFHDKVTRLLRGRMTTRMSSLCHFKMRRVPKILGGPFAS